MNLKALVRLIITYSDFMFAVDKKHNDVKSLTNKAKPIKDCLDAQKAAHKRLRGLLVASFQLEYFISGESSNNG